MEGALERTEPIRLGYVGCGFMAQAVHLPNFSTLSGCRLLALAEVRPGLARAVAERFRIERIYSSHLELAEDPDIEAVGVSAGFGQQGEIAADLLRSGKHVFMEKPMAVSVAQAERLLEAASQGGARLMVGYMKRHDPGNVLARETIARWQAEGDAGDVVYARNHGFCGDWLSRLDRSSLISTDEPMPQATVDDLLPDWLPAEQRSGYVGYLQQYTHNINLLRYLLGAGDEVAVRSTDLDADGIRGLVVLDAGGVRAVVESGGIAYHDWDEHTQVYFQRGWVHAWSPPLMARESQARVEVYRGGEGAAFTHPVPPAGWAYREEAAAFLRCLRSGEEFRSSGRDTLTDVRLFEEIYRRHLGV
ncbi:MAG TPA: Gfo/Idh/MocA family oxidoreductase [Candidatus Dormibacteraeota bacterium]|jgi:predicted dehydrogenase|nr:Gfo/Idh/MocA family oxidoreductase [Candidatus Dormibacteraeota bacterium]